MKYKNFLFSGFLIVIVSGAATSPNLFAQTQSLLHLRDGPKTIQQQPVGEDHVSSSLNRVYSIDIAECQAGQTPYPAEQCTYPGASRAVSVSEDTTIVYGTGQNQDRVFLPGAAGNIMAQRYEVLPGARLTSVLVAPMYDNEFHNSTVPVGAPRDFTLRIWNVDGSGFPGDEIYSMDVNEAADASHISQDLAYSFLHVDLPEDEESLATLPDRIFIGLTNKGSDRNYLVFATSRRKDTAPDNAAYSYETINSNTRWYPLANLLLSNGLSLRDQVFPIRPRFLVSEGAQSAETILAYDTGRNDDRIYIRGTAETIMAQRYEAPSGSRLASVSVAPVYDNQFRNSTVPDDAPRDFTLRIWDVTVNNLPGHQLYSMDVEEGITASHVRSDDTYSFLRIDLSPDEEVLSALPDRIFIGLVNKGTDENYLAIATSRRASNAPDGIAYLYSDTRWHLLANLLVNQQQLNDHVFPIRARFLADTDPVSTDDPAELPSGVKLAQNYPNPFNPVTSISWVQPGSAQVRLSVYNLLGQQIAMPADGLYPAGGHEVRLDASGWASGVYIYALETETHMLTRRMVLLK